MSLILPKGDDESLPRPVMQAVQDAFRAFLGQKLNAEMVGAIDRAIESARVTLLLRGHKIPRMAVVALERRGFVQLVRRDLEPVGIERVIQNLMVRFPDLGHDEMQPAIQRAFPHYHRDDAGEETERVAGAIKQKAKTKARMAGAPIAEERPRNRDEFGSPWPGPAGWD